MDVTTLRAKLDAAHYIYDESLVTTLLVALKLGRPLLIEGAAGTGNTQVLRISPRTAVSSNAATITAVRAFLSVIRPMMRPAQ